MADNLSEPLLRRVRKALAISQPDFAKALGRSLGAIRKYESGGRKPPVEILAGAMSLCVNRGLMDLAKEVELTAVGSARATAHSPRGGDGAPDPLHDVLDRIIRSGNIDTIYTVNHSLQMALFWLTSGPSRSAQARSNEFRERRFSLDLAAVLSRPETPEFLRETASLYLRFRKHPDADGVFKQATEWLRHQFQLMGYTEKIEALSRQTGQRLTEPDYVGTLLREAAEEPLVRTAPPKKAK